MRQIKWPGSLLALLLLLAAGSSQARASIRVNIQGDLLKDQSGVPIPTTTGLFMLVASTVDAVFTINMNIAAGAAITPGTILGDDDMLIYSGGLNSPGFAGVMDVGNVLLDFSNTAYKNAWGPNDRLALLWFPTLPANSTVLPVGARYGFYDGGVAATANATDAISTGVDGSKDWITPPNLTSSYSLSYYNKDGVYFGGPSSTNLGASGNALGTVIAVPEPSAFLLAALGCAGFFSRRRRGDS